jgi:hypothetical protein
MANPYSPGPGSGFRWQEPSATTNAAAPRILPFAPSNLPVDVRLSYFRYLFTSLRGQAILSIVFGVLMIGYSFVKIRGADETIHSARYGDMDSHLIGWLGLGVGAFLLGNLFISAKRRLRDGFAAGADHTGVYLRPTLDDRTVFVPWQGVESVRIVNWHGPQLVVKPRDPVLESAFAMKGRGSNVGARAGTALAQQRRVKKLGTNIHAPVPGADRAELLNNLRYQAAGRAQVEMP